MLTITPEAFALALALMTAAGLVAGYLLGREHERNHWRALLEQVKYGGSPWKDGVDRPVPGLQYERPTVTPLADMLSFGSEIDEEGRP